jgi:signal transduction histidine kinase
VEYFHPMNRFGSVVREYWWELLIAAMLISGIVQLVVEHDSPGAPTSTLWFQIPALCLLALPLFARRRFPFGAPASYWVLAAALSFADGLVVVFPDSFQVIGLASALLLGNLRDRRKAAVGLALVVGSMIIVLYNIPGSWTVSAYVFVTLRFAAAWVAGFALRAREEQAEAAEVRAVRAETERETAARIAVAEERTRIARELHDVVAHAVSVMVLQVGAVRHKLPDSLADDRDALRSVERAGRTALAEMRRLLGAMRREGDEVEFVPQPGLDGLNALLAEVGRAGLPARLHVDGDPFPLPRGVDLSAYRIVQEGLTNALKHAHASETDVTLRYRPDEIEIEVRDNGESVAPNDGLGHGLVGVRERVKIYGGKMSAGKVPEGGFVLSTRLPIADEGPS